MAKPEWGTKRTCQSCGARFYDFGRSPIVCPACNTPFDVETLARTRRSRPVARLADETSGPIADDAEIGEETETEEAEETSDDAEEAEVVDESASEDDEEEDHLIEDAADLGDDDDDVSDVIEGDIDDDDARH